MTEPTCPACNKPYAEHPGVQALCRDLAAAKAEIERLEALFKQEMAIHRVLNREKNAELAAAKSRESKVREDVAALRDVLIGVKATIASGAIAGTVDQAFRLALTMINELETFKEST